MTAWCEPGQALLSGGYELQGAEPPAPETTTEEEAPPEPPVVFVASSRPTVRLDRKWQRGSVRLDRGAQYHRRRAGPLVAYAVCAGEPSPAPPAESMPPPPRRCRNQKPPRWARPR